MARAYRYITLIILFFSFHSAYAENSCLVNYDIVNDWGNGFTTNVTITNSGDSWSGWEVKWTMPNDQKITGLWNGKLVQTGSSISVKSYNWNGNVSSGGSAKFGFNGSYSGENTAPYDITVNGTLCSGQAEAPANNGDDAKNTPEPEKEVVCEASYVVRNQWNTGFTSDIIIKNQGDALDNWTVTWTMPLSDQKVGHGWNGNFSQQDNLVTVTPAGWNQKISSGGQISFGFNGKYGDENPVPIDLAIDGVKCGGQPDSVLVSPKAPSSLSAIMLDNTNAVLTWTDNSNNEDSFIIERRQPNQNWQQLLQIAADTIRYEDETIGIGETYEYRVKANNKIADSAYSNTVSVTRQDHSQIGSQMLVDNCSSCHGTDGTSTGPATPTIAGLDRDYIINTMALYQTDARASTIMGRLARGYSTEQIALIADSLASKTYTPATQETDAELVKLGRQIHDENCSVCHTDNGHALVTGSPLAGQWKTYLTATLTDYLENPTDNVPAGMLTQINSLESRYGENALAAIIDFYAANPDDTTGTSNDTDNTGDTGDDSTGGDTDNGDGSNTATAPSLPTGISSSAVDNELINISWIDNSNNETGFKIERTTDNANWTEIADVTADVSSYTDSDVSAGNSYTYRITAYNTIASAISAETSTTLLTVLDYGKNEYTNQGCSTCHGADGSGGFTGKPLTGFTNDDLSSLTQTNTTTMPPSDPDACVGNCAYSIARYIIEVLAADAGDGETGGDDTTAQACSGVAPASSRSLRLLTRYEYENTVNDLLGLSVSIIHELPDENRVNGFDNNIDANQVTSLRLEAFINKAEDLAAQALSESRSHIVPCTTTDTACAKQFIETFGKKAYRRPLTDAEQTTYLAFFSQDSFDSAVEKTVMVMLSSPHMLYRSELGELQEDGTYQLTSYEIASSLSYLFWGSMPDDELMTLADNDALKTDAQRIAQAYRLLNDERSKAQVGNFVGQWLLGSNPYSLPEKDQSVYPDYTNDVRAALSQELVNFFNHVAFDSSQKYRELFSSNYVLANNTLASFYSLTAPSGSEFAVIPVTDDTRSGILTLGAVLAKYANSNESHPFKRGAFIFERLLCHDLPAAANMGIIQTPVVDEDATTRERFAFHSESSESCYSCHQYLDGPGFSLESYNGAGQFRSTENGQAVDTTGILRGLETYTPEEEISFDNSKQLSTIISESPTASQCVAKQYYQYVAGREETSADSCAIDAFLQTYKESDYNLQTMLLGIVNSPNFIKRHAK